ncbi:MAG TPA: hypothetical protein VF765_09755 [Polyangiaceae bacterium]
MIRSSLVSLLALVPSPWLLACTHVTAATAPVAVPHPPPVPPMTVDYRVVRTVDGEGTVLAGRTDLERGSHGARVKAVAAHNAAEAELEFTARDTEDGSIIIRVSYDERGTDGSTIRWEPEMRVVRGVPIRAEAAGNGWGRSLVLTAE